MKASELTTANIVKKAFSQKGSLNRHIQTVHEEIKDFQCQFCNHASSNKCDLKKHILRIHEDKQVIEIDNKD